MYQLNYHSISKPNLNLGDLEDILEEAVVTNSSRNITGCLIYHDNKFVQILEGRKQDVIDVFEKIKGDNRHHSVTMLWENRVENRFFAEWNMAYHRPHDNKVKQFVNNLILLSEYSERSSGSLLSFWATVKGMLGGGTIRHVEKV